MVYVKVRETYDLHTTKDKMTVIGIHTPRPEIIKRDFPGLLMQCKAYRPVSADVRLACASMLPLDPQGVGLDVGDVAPEDVFNPILYKAMSNKSMSALELRLHCIPVTDIDVDGSTSLVDVDTVTNKTDEFDVYYGLLSDAHSWKHANPQQGLSMSNLRPLVYEMNYNVGYSSPSDPGSHYQGSQFLGPAQDGSVAVAGYQAILGKAKEMPFINCTSYTGNAGVQPGFAEGAEGNYQKDVPYIEVFCGCIVVPPSRLHELFYRMVVEWTIEFSSIRPLHEIQNWSGLEYMGSHSHYQNYSYTATKEAVTGDPKSILDSDSCMVSANVDIQKVM